MANVVLDAKLAPNNLADPRTGPEVRRIARTASTLEQTSLKLAPLTSIDLWRTPGCRLRFDGIMARFKKARLPSADRPAVDLELSGYVDWLKPLFKKTDSNKTATFKLRRAAEWSHAQRLGH